MRTALRFLVPLAAAAGAAAAIVAAPTAAAAPPPDPNAPCLNVAPNALGEQTQTCPPWDTQFATQPSQIHDQSTFLYPGFDSYYGPATVVNWG
ncbi:hypothetical protein JRC04_23025 [Mycolicibacterium sp. S2-37]|uniref:hypothetical protein n=1 Tax=Mycolicibacterium sp. S2-37 TaxID=2810297 RepID=UPI001A93DEA6|nr:hypothetical protein [Mycolicibacterium sp. S2-37]MBO0680349.1 hypothetical protein [Mycolicibacterium sp. S2-37]